MEKKENLRKKEYVKPSWQIIPMDFIAGGGNLMAGTMDAWNQDTIPGDQEGGDDAKGNNFCYDLFDTDTDYE